MKKYDIVIMHGTGGSPEGNWFGWLADKLRAEGHNVFVPRFPTPENQSVKSWCEVLRNSAPIFDNNTILIGHSLGAAYLLHVLESLGGDAACPVFKNIHQSIFVSGFAEPLGGKFDELNADFINHNFNWEKIRNVAGKITILHGDNDPYVPMSAAENLARNLQTELTVIPNGGHLNAEFGYTEFPEILEVLK